ncbi:SRPBCC domain-containing protein [Rhizobium sp. CF142]|uniref:SRPBCC domain-containing protein n=1 Tax=Rhizobium sp. CF142 TaxID=1144314 RepID=UPI00026EF2A1|nr:SRPBCC domain-containing protein [Rhizobium sp. CF142]EJJ29481.1 hypothetical protein PMI11_02220 [Rhizobium sp. CF142]
MSATRRVNFTYKHENQLDRYAHGAIIAGSSMGIVLEDTVRIAAPRPLMWILLKEADVLEACIPGCSGLQTVPDSPSAISVSSWFGEDSADITINFQARRFGASGSFRVGRKEDGIDAVLAKGQVLVELLESEGATLLHYGASLHVDGDADSATHLLVADAMKRTVEVFLHRLTALAEKMRAEDAEAIG